MKTEDQLKRQISNLRDQIDNVNNWRTGRILKFGDLSEQENSEYHRDILFLESQISALEWVIQNDETPLIQTI